MLCIGLGCLCSFCFLQAQLAGAPTFGMEDAKIAEVAGIIREDSVALRGGRGMCTLSVTHVTDGAGSQASGRGIIPIILREGEKLSWGQTAKIPVSLRREDGERDAIAFQTGPAERLGFTNSLFQVRSEVLWRASREIAYMLGGGGSFFMAIFLGQREDPSDPIFLAFRTSGCAHIMALSGMHLGIVAAFLYLIFKPLFGRNAAFAVVLPFIVFYTLLVGPKPSLIRAMTMFSIAGLCRIRGREFDPISLLSLVFVLMTVAYPSSVKSISFKLSFLALLGIFTFGRALVYALSGMIPRAVAAPLGMSVGAQLATLPVLGLEFGVFYPIGIIASVIVAPLVTVYLWSASGLLLCVAVGAVFYPADFLCSLAVRVLEITEEAMFLLMRLFGGVAGVVLPVPVALLLSIVVPCLWLYMVRKKKVRYCAGN